MEDTTTSSGQSGGPTSSTIDSNHPYYIHPSDNPGAMLVPVQFTGVGFCSWRRSVLRTLSVKNKLGFVNGDCSRPRSSDPSYRQWERCDNIVTSWILNSLSKEIADSVEYVQDSAELWKELEDRYEQTNGAKLYQIQREINDLSQGSLDITSYYTKLKKLWEEISTLNAKAQCTCNCTCGAKALTHKAEQDRRLIQFLMGLNEMYTVIRGSILMMNPLPNMAQAFSLLVQDEHQREIKPSSFSNAESTALYTGNTRPSSSSGNIRPHSSAGNVRPPSSYKTNYAPNGSHGHSQLQYKDRFCTHCNRTGHLAERCYQLHGYPAGSNANQRNNSIPRPNNSRRGSQRNNRESGNNVVANASCTSDFADFAPGRRTDEEMYNVNLTKDQYSHVRDILQQFHKKNENDGGSNENSNLASGSSTDFADEEMSYDHLASGLKVTLESDKSAFDADRLQKYTGPQLRKMLNWSKPLPLEDERVRLLHEVGLELERSFEGKASKLVESCDNSAAKLVALMTRHFPGFRDHTVYKGHQIFLYKRAQIFAADLWGAFKGQGYGDFEDISSITIFADYIVPAVLQQLGVLRYRSSLDNIIKKNTEIVSGSEEEVELRACSVYAVEKMKELISKKTGKQVLSVELDLWLWAFGIQCPSLQHHRTLSIYY